MIIKEWNLVGRDLGFVQVGSGITFYFRKELDAEGRVISEGTGSSNQNEKYSYQYDNSGRITKIKNPEGKETRIIYASRKEL